MALFDDTQDRLAPVAIGLGLAVVGAALMSTKPSLLSLPEPKTIDAKAKSTGFERAVTKMRDGVSYIAPANAGTSIGRALVIAGLGLIITRALDELIAKVKRT